MGCASSGAPAVQELGSFTTEYSMGVKLGEGRFAQVRQATLRSSNESFAVKILDLRYDQSAEKDIEPAKLKKARDEAAAMRIIGEHENCAVLVACFQERCLYYMVLRKCEASLMDQLEQMPHRPISHLAHIFRHMLLGIAHVHDVGLVHRDVKPNNFLFADDMWTVKIADFGMTVCLPKKGMLKGQFGTPPYMSPEMIAYKGYKLEADIWSYGVSVYVLLYSTFPYMSQEESSEATKGVILAGKPEPGFARPPADGLPLASVDATLFVRSVMVRSPKDRLTALEALEQPFVQGAATSKEESNVCPAHAALVGSPAVDKLSCNRTREFQAKLCQKVTTDELLSRLDSHTSSFSAEAKTENSDVGSKSATLLDVDIKATLLTDALGDAPKKYASDPLPAIVAMQVPVPDARGPDRQDTSPLKASL